MSSSSRCANSAAMPATSALVSPSAVLCSASSAWSCSTCSRELAASAAAVVSASSRCANSAVRRGTSALVSPSAVLCSASSAWSCSTCSRELAASAAAVVSASSRCASSAVRLLGCLERAPAPRAQLGAARPARVSSQLRRAAVSASSRGQLGLRRRLRSVSRARALLRELGLELLDLFA